MTLPALPPPATGPALRLGSRLLWRLVGATTLLLLALLWMAWHDWREQLATDLPATAELASQLLHDDLAGRAGAFNRPQLTATLAPLAPLARRAAFCAELRNLQGRLMDQGCLPRLPPASLTGAAGPPADFGLLLVGAEPSPADWPWPARAARWLATAGGAPASQTHTLVLPEGLKLGTLELEPDWTHEAGQLGRHLGLIALGGLALLAGLLHIARTATRQWAQDHRQQQQLASHLLNAREQERRRLARELHDELGQSLTALHAEAAVVALVSAGAAGTAPALTQSAQAMRRLLAQMQEGLQRVLADLRPQALDRFGLPSALQALARQTRLHADGTPLTVTLQLPEPWRPLPADHDIHVYRIVQEALTNAWRHSAARHATVSLRPDGDLLHLSVQDDGQASPLQPVQPGHGLLGLHERVAALGGTLRCTHPEGGGLCLSVRLPCPRPTPASAPTAATPPPESPA
ncbi:sensor histidine kinase [Ideonella livida]|uniref:Sensor histidine kinase n=1 Tax=Ideonella livida TaxID=2707176 RepID=A0A7C9PEV6_9BURK|nr:sensor histidine kinase [Ideonella livida]NDY89851.1 sensor histidine kinase [Ideonella livida]